jgi:hypothetical protein
VGCLVGLRGLHSFLSGGDGRGGMVGQQTAAWLPDPHGLTSLEGIDLDLPKQSVGISHAPLIAVMHVSYQSTSLHQPSGQNPSSAGSSAT